MARATSGFSPAGFRIEPAHAALQFGELEHHGRLQVGLGEEGGAGSGLGIGANQRRKFACERHDALHPVALAAELGMEGDVVEIADPLVEAALRDVAICKSLSQKNLASESRARTTLPLPRAISAPPSDGMMLETSRKRLVSLFRPACSTKHFWFSRMVSRVTSSGNARKSFVELAHDDDRPFDQIGGLLQQALVLHQFEAAGEGKVAGIGKDDFLAAFGVQNDLRRLELANIVVEALDA